MPYSSFDQWELIATQVPSDTAQVGTQTQYLTRSPDSLLKSRQQARNKALLLENSNPFSATDTGQILNKGDGILLTTVGSAETATEGSDRIA